MEGLVEAVVGAEDKNRQSRKEDSTAKIFGNGRARRLSRILVRVDNMTIEGALKHCELRNLSERTVDKLDNELGRPPRSHPKIRSKPGFSTPHT